MIRRFAPLEAAILALFWACAGHAQPVSLAGGLSVSDYLSYTGFQLNSSLNSPCSQAAFNGAGAFRSVTKTQTGTTVTAAVDYATAGLNNGLPMTAYSLGNIMIYAQAPPGTTVLLRGRRTGTTIATSSGATVNASAPQGQHTASLPGGPAVVAIDDDLFPGGGSFVTGAASGSCPGYSYVTTIDMGTYLVVNNNCPGTTCGVAEAINKVTVTAETGAAPTWTRLAPTGTLPAARFLHAWTYDPNTNQGILFGGRINYPFQNLNDLWRLSNANGLNGTPAWTQVVPAGGPPSTRAGATVSYDSARNRMILFGGALGGDSPCSNETWVLANANGTGGTPTWTPLAPTGVAPSPRFTHTQIYDPGSNRLTIFSGENCFVVLPADVWVLSNANGLGGTPAWTQLSPTGASPAARENATAVYDAANNLMILYGGGAYGSLYSDVWVLSHANGQGGTPAWTQLNVTGPGPGARAGHTAEYDAATNTMTVFGGVTAANVELNDTWVLSHANGLGGTPAWTQLGPFSELPAARSGRTAMDPASGNIMLFGGDTNGTDWNDTWVLGDVGAVPPQITVTPATGVNNQSVSVVLAGSSKLNGAAVKLAAAGQPDIPGTSVSNPSATILQATFNLNGAAAGARNVVITAADSSTITLTNGFTITQAPPCSYSVSPQSVTMGSGGGSGSFVVNTSSPQCAWTLGTAPGWIGATAAAPVVKYTVQANGSSSERAGVIPVIANNAVQATFTINEGGVTTCTYAINYNGYTFPASGGSTTVQVTAPGGCAWSVTGNPGWLGFPNGTSGSGNGSVTITAQANSGGPRSGSLSIAGKPFSVSQAAGGACGALDVSAQIRVTQGPMQLFSAVGSLYDRNVTLTNISSQTVPGPIYLVLDGIPDYSRPGCTPPIAPFGCTLVPAYPVTHCLSPSPVGSSLVLWSQFGLAPGQSVGGGNIGLTFKGGSIIALQQYTTRVLSGHPNQ